MSRSSDWVYRYKEQIQRSIDERPTSGKDALFDLRDLVSAEAWNEVASAYLKPTREFARRMISYPNCVDPVFHRVQSRMILGETDGTVNPLFRRMED
ncbi:hypothetical protein SAMN05421688_1373 [Poseidonocella pacifica]|uniref:Uncharacterized protein n=1 Tax=Poseidonocella pacifica TaxID=871651 RepID=A0A1I0WF13_9RHOB|nr:hypothetical protein [Poseidonocella pacifica]SFA87349.1 hypothetical protein SAMN05421688_1373 [Poseidonocella pacifica]